MIYNYEECWRHVTSIFGNKVSICIYVIYIYFYDNLCVFVKLLYHRFVRINTAMGIASCLLREYLRVDTVYRYDIFLAPPTNLKYLCQNAKKITRRSIKHKKFWTTIFGYLHISIIGTALLHCFFFLFQWNTQNTNKHKIELPIHWDEF